MKTLIATIMARRERERPAGHSACGRLVGPRAVTLLVCCLVAAPLAAAGSSDDIQDLIFFGETRPLLVRLHLRIDGKPLPAATDEFLRHLFKMLDVNGDGALSKEEAARAPGVDQLTADGFAFLVGGPAAAGNGPSWNELDADRDGRVTLAELAGYYRKRGFAPCQFQVEAGAASNQAMAFLGGRPEPTVEEISSAVFNLLDADKDGKLTQAELSAAPRVFLALDGDDDEIVTPKELVPNTRPASPNMFSAAMSMMAGAKQASSGNPVVQLVSPAGPSPADLARQLQKRYGKKEGAALRQQDVGLDAATFELLDSNGDGVLDGGELANFAQRPADLELNVELGKGHGIAITVPAALLGSGAIGEHSVTLDLGLTRLGLATAAARGSDDLGYVNTILRQQLQGQFRQADKDKSGYLDAKEAEASPAFRSFHKLADRDGDGKLYEEEILAFIEEARALRRRAASACASLVLADQSRGLFDLLDSNRDGRLSVREMRGASGLLTTLARSGRDHLTRADIPRTYQLTLRRGPAGKGGPAAGLAALYGPVSSTEIAAPSAGPLWFRKMDRNRDGDVSPREFLFASEVFRRLDSDADGLISVDEAERAGR